MQLRILTLALLLLSSCGLYRQTIKTEKAWENAGNRIAAAATNVSSRVQTSNDRAKDTGQFWKSVQDVFLEWWKKVAVVVGLLLAWYAEEIKQKVKGIRNGKKTNHIGRNPIND